MRFLTVTLLLQGALAMAAPEALNNGVCTPVTVTATVTKTVASTSKPKTTSSKTTSKTTKTTSSSSKPIATSQPPVNAKGKFRNVLYFTNWGIYRANTMPDDMPVDTLTHVLYSFADINYQGDVIATDTYADYEKQMPGETIDWNNPKKVAYGCVGRLFALKKKNRNLKVILSIGGWTYSQNKHFDGPASTAAGRQRFAQSAVKLMADWGFDGIDIDWEYPSSTQQGKDYVALLAATRKALDQYAAKNKQNYRYELTVAASAGAQHYKLQDLGAMDKYLDAWHLMTYDYAGGWDQTTGHQANIFMSKTNPASTKFDSDSAIRDYIASGIQPSKIVFGIPLYGRSFANAAGMGKSYNGLGRGSIENGVFSYKDLPQPGASMYYDDKVGAAWSWDKSTKELVSFDTPKIVTLKANYIKKMGLGGAFYWEASQDKKGSNSLVRVMAKNFQGNILQKPNQLSYPESTFDNIKNGN